ncbi:hypothetical protein [Paenibacillus sp. CECT 9249]|uniref:hypothetical protein n=1 Tax=Paenibacillus sp. CECT 9249 TaxID=2845385 RepID=UPI001E2CA2F4|nr:hypothetical protein [Paenibacillus sp. CECT 9249]
MDLWTKERIVKLKLVDSIAHSQQAIARILNVIADVAEHEESKELARRIGENMQVVTGYQQALSSMAAGVASRRLKKGTPTKPWLAPAFNALTNGTRGVQEDKRNEKNKDKGAKKEKNSHREKGETVIQRKTPFHS